jgi:hypothetical protein
MDSESESISINTASSSSSVVASDDDSSIGSEVVVDGCRVLSVVIEIGSDMALPGRSIWQGEAETPIQFLLQQLDMSRNDKDWRCIAGSYALYCFETKVLARSCDWRSGDVDIFHVCTYTEFLWRSFYPFLARLWSWGFHIRLYSTATPPGGERISPLRLMGYAMQGITNADVYENMPVDALFDVDVSAITDEVECFSFLLNSDLSDTLEVVDNFDIDICQLRMIWPSGEDQYAIYAPTSISNNIMMRQMSVTFRHLQGQNEQKTRKRKEKYERRGYKTIAIRYSNS